MYFKTFFSSEHPDYVRVEQLNDISVVQTIEEIVFNELTQPIPLIDRLVTSETLRTSGWGDTTPRGGETPNELTWIETTVLPFNECARVIPEYINPDSFCTISKFDKIDQQGL